MKHRFEDLADEALAAHFEGWDFSFIEGRRTVEPVEWDYSVRVARVISDVESVIDLGTGGGEVLGSFAPLPAISVATESYLPNVELAARRLGPLGVHVVRVSDGTCNTLGPGQDDRHPDRRLPLRDETFDLVIARNTAFSPGEAFRILKPGGRLVTQNGLPSLPGQIELWDHLGGQGPDWGHWDFLQPALDAGFEIEEYLEATPHTHYLDIGAVIYVLEHIPWAVVDYSFDRYRQRLKELHDQIESRGPLVTEGRGCFLQARKPEA